MCKRIPLALNVFRYSHAENYANSKGHGRVDLPHAVIMLGYDFGHGWTFNTEIEFEHGGTESAVEVEAEETGEFEKEIERGSEVVRLESTIGIYGTGLLDAIPDDSLKAQYLKESMAGAHLNPAMWAGTDWAPTGLYGKTNHPKRFTYACSRGPLQDGPGANAIWNITNVTRGDRRYHYMTETYARIASQDPDVQAAFYTYFPEYNKTGNPETDIYNYLMSRELPAEMSNDVEAIMWHGSAQSDARWTVEKFRNLSKEDRDAVVKFINAI